MNAESVGKGQHFSIGGVLVSVCSLVVVRLSGLRLCAGKRSMWRSKEAERIV